jgi:drug/metabolite transporter (DMT)-like permease
MLWFFAMARIPIAEVTAIGYTTPIFTVVGAVLIFGERIHMRRIIAIIIGFIGILIILRPGFETIEIGSLAQLVAAPCFAISFLFAKKLTNTENSSDTLVMLSIFCTLALMPGALYLWKAPTVTELAWLALVAVFATAGHYALTKSIANAPLTVTQPFSFLQLVWAILFGYLIFDEVPDVWVCLGAAMIVAVISYMSHREAAVIRKHNLQSSSSMPT